MQTPNKEGHKLPMLTPKNPDGSQRVIKQIMVIDPNKLRVAGLDLKMAEALKKAKGKMSNSSSSKDTKLAIAKSIVSKKIRQAQLSKESNKQTNHVTSQQLSNSVSIQDTISNLSFTNPTATKPQIKVANLKTLMPPPPAPAHAQTVMLSFIKPEKSDVLNNSIDCNKNNEPDQIPKASTKKLSAQPKLIPQPKAIASKVVSSEVKFEMKKPIEVETVAPKIIKVKLISPTKETFSESPPHKHRPKVIESKVLSPEEKIDLSTLRVKAPSILLPLVPSTNLPIQNNEATTKCCVEETSPVRHPRKEKPPYPVVESAVDFISNLSFMFEATSKCDSNSKNTHTEDATSFLMSLFEQMPAKVPSNSPASSKLVASSEQTTPFTAIELLQSKIPEAIESNHEVCTEATSEQCPPFQETNQQTVAIESTSTVCDSPKKQPPQTVENVIKKHPPLETITAPKKDSSAHLVNQNNETAGKTEQVAKSSLLGILKKAKKSVVEDNLTTSHPNDSSPSLPSETQQSSPLDRPTAEETSSGTSAESSRRKGRKCVPLLIAKLNKSRKTPVLQEKLPEQVEGVSKTEDKSAEQLDKLIKLPSEPPPPPVENITDGKELMSASSPKPIIRRKSTKSLPIVIAKLNKTRKPPESQKKPPKVDEDTNATEEVQSAQTKVTEVIQKPLLATTSRESHQMQNEVSVLGSDGDNIKEPGDQFPKSARESDDKSTKMQGLSLKSSSQVKEVLIPRTGNPSTCKPSPELEILAQDVGSQSAAVVSDEPVSTSIRSRKTSERSKAPKSVDASLNSQKEHAIQKPTDEAASVSLEEMVTTSTRPRKTSERSKGPKSVDASLTPQKENAIQKPTEEVAFVPPEEIASAFNRPRKTSERSKALKSVDASLSPQKEHSIQEPSDGAVSVPQEEIASASTRPRKTSEQSKALISVDIPLTHQKEHAIQKPTVEAPSVQPEEMATTSTRPRKTSERSNALKSVEASLQPQKEHSIQKPADGAVSVPQEEIASASTRPRKTSERSKATKSVDVPLTPQKEHSIQKPADEAASVPPGEIASASTRPRKTSERSKALISVDIPLTHQKEHAIQKPTVEAPYVQPEEMATTSTRPRKTSERSKALKSVEASLQPQKEHSIQKPADGAVSVPQEEIASASIRPRKTSERSKATKSVDVPLTPQKEHSIQKPADEAASVPPGEIASASTRPRKTSEQSKALISVDIPLTHQKEHAIQKPTVEAPSVQPEEMATTSTRPRKTSERSNALKSVEASLQPQKEHSIQKPADGAVSVPQEEIASASTRPRKTSERSKATKSVDVPLTPQKEHSIQKPADEAASVPPGEIASASTRPRKTSERSKALISVDVPLTHQKEHAIQKPTVEAPSVQPEEMATTSTRPRKTSERSKAFKSVEASLPPQKEHSIQKPADGAVSVTPEEIASASTRPRKTCERSKALKSVDFPLTHQKEHAIQKPTVEAPYVQPEEMATTSARPRKTSERSKALKSVDASLPPQKEHEIQKGADGAVSVPPEEIASASTRPRKTSERKTIKPVDASPTIQKEVVNPAEETAVKVDETASRPRKQSERCETLNAVYASPATQSEHKTDKPAEVVASVEPNKIASLPREQSKVSKETRVIEKTKKSVDTRAESKPDSQIQDKKEEVVTPSKSITSTIDGSCKSKGSTAELLSELPQKNEQKLAKSTKDDPPLEKADVTPARSRKEKVTNTSVSTENLPAILDQRESLSVIKIAETPARSRKPRERSKTPTATGNVENTNESTVTSHTRVESATSEREQTNQSSEMKEKVKITPPAGKTRGSSTPKSVKTYIKSDKAPNLDKESEKLGEIKTIDSPTSAQIAKGKVKRSATKRGAKNLEIPSETTDAANEVPKTPAPANKRKSRSTSKSTAALSSQKTTKIINIVTEELLKQSASTTESVQTSVRLRSQRSTAAKCSKNTLNSITDGVLNTLPVGETPDTTIKVDCSKETADTVATTSKTRRRTKADPKEVHPTAPMCEAFSDASASVIGSKSDEPKKSKASRRRKTTLPTDDIPQTSKTVSPESPKSTISGTHGKRSYDSSGLSVNCHEFDDCDHDVRALLDMVTSGNETAKEDARQLHITPKQRRSKNLHKKDSSEENQVTVDKEEASFFGFNEQEIEEGQQSTSLRLSQSDEVVPMHSAPQSGNKKKQSPPGKGKNKKTEQNWKKNSSASLKNWLTTAGKSTKQAEKVQQEANEINSSIPLKKRRARDQNLDESIKLDDNVKCPPQGDTSAIEASRADKSNPITTSDPDVSKTSIKPKRGKRKSLSVKKDEYDAKEETDEFKKTPTAAKLTKRKRSLMEEDTPSTEPAAKKSHLLAKAGQFVFQQRKLGRPSKHEATPKRVPKPYTRIVPVSPLERKYKNDTEFNPRLLLITHKEEIKNDEPLIDPDMQTEPTSSDDLQCALCMGYTSKKKWFPHISNHYGIGWVVGNPPPLNIKSRPSVLNYMVEFFKNSRVKGLNCRICKRQRRSALGLLTHLEQCCLTEDELKESRVVCEHCRHEYSKSSIPAHLRTCPEFLKKTKAEESADPKSVNKVGGEDDMLSNTGRLKRKSVIKAENKLKNLDDSEFIPDEVIKRIPPRRPDLYPSTWRLEIEAFGKGFCVEKKCPFTAPTVDELVEHTANDGCPFMEKVGFKCMKCKFHSVDIEPCRLHVVEKHSPQPERDFECSDDDAEFGSESSSDSISSGVDENDEDGSTEQIEGEEHKRKRKKKKAKKRNKIKTHQSQKDFKKLLPDREFDIAYRVKRWYEKFVNENYSTDPLFIFATPIVVQIDNAHNYESYFPKSPISMKFVLRGFKGFVKELGKTQIAPENWQTLERSKGTGLANEHAAYLGGPVKSIAWAPLEPHPASKTQYLAVATRKVIDKFSRFKEPKQSRVLIYIQKYIQEEENVISGEMHYAFPIEVGPVHCVEFLPSGGYAPIMNRLGLLAVATVASEVKIYSLPLEVENKESDSFPIIRLEPSIELCLDMEDSPSTSKYTQPYQSQCMSIAWSQTTGHNYVIGGYLNGFVAIWDITEEDDNLNRFLVNGLRKFVPVSYFWTVDNRIKHVVPHYDVNGLRWLGICNQNRKIFLYDLREITNPTLFYAETTKNICNSLDWPIVWENPSCGHGDAMPSHGKCINTISPMSLVFVNRRFDKFCCGVNDISFNPWRNLYAGAADNGDINVTPLREAILDVGLRLKIDEKAMSTLDIVSLDGSALNKNLSDGIGLLEADYKQKYGLVFAAPQRIVGSKHREMYAEKRIPPLNLARLMRINRLRFNPNRSSNSLLAVGYENGFVRVIQSDWHKTS